MTQFYIGCKQVQAWRDDHEAESPEKPHHPENGLPSLGHFHRGASPCKRALMSDQ